VTQIELILKHQGAKFKVKQFLSRLNRTSKWRQVENENKHNFYFLDDSYL